MHLRPAAVSDIPLLRRWDETPHVKAALGVDGQFDWEREVPERVDWRQMLIAERDGRPIGFLQIIDPAREPTGCWAPVAPNQRAIDIWIGEADCLGRGFGTEMMRLALARCFAAPAVTAVLIDPLADNVRAQRFYARLGFRPIEHQSFGAENCLVMRLDRADWAPAEPGPT